jgi:hypothetical protein
MTPDGPAASSAKARGIVARYWRLVLLVGGVGLAVILVRSAGTGEVVRVLGGAWGWLPLVALLEIGFIAFDLLALRVLLGTAAASLTVTDWVRSSTLAYATTALLPAGRAAGEAARAATLSRAVGTARAAGACARLQAASLVGNGTVSVAGASLLFFLERREAALSATLLLNAVATLGLATTLFALLRSGRFATWLRRKFPKFAEAHASTPAPSDRIAIPAASLLAVCGRVSQLAQYAVVLHAVGGTVTVASALTAQAIHLIGAAAGDLVPNQMGATEGAYRAFAGALGLGAEPARALSIALVVRIAQSSLAALCMLVASFVVPRERETT